MFGSLILLATDGSLEARRAGRVAMDLARKLDLELHLVHVAPISSVYAVQGMLSVVDLVDPALRQKLHEHAVQNAREVLDEQVRRITDAGGSVTEAHPEVGRPDAEIVRLAEELDAGLIVLGSRGEGPFKRAAVGSVAESVVKHAHCPVLVARTVA